MRKIIFRVFCIHGIYIERVRKRERERGIFGEGAEMGQAFRRATGRIGSSRVDAAPSQLKKPLDGRMPPAKNVPVENSGSVAGE